MTHSEIKALERLDHAALAWTAEGYDGQTHYADVLKALMPALVVIASAAALMLAIL